MFAFIQSVFCHTLQQYFEHNLESKEMKVLNTPHQKKHHTACFTEGVVGHFKEMYENKKLNNALPISKYIFSHSCRFVQTTKYHEQENHLSK